MRQPRLQQVMMKLGLRGDTWGSMFILSRNKSSEWDQSPVVHSCYTVRRIIIKNYKKSSRTDNRNDFFQLREFLSFDSIKYFVPTVIRLDIILKHISDNTNMILFSTIFLRLRTLKQAFFCQQIQVNEENVARCMKKKILLIFGSN